MRRVCFVTDELYPFTAGGIGRLIHNLVVDSLARSPDTEFHILAPEGPIRAEGVKQYFGGRVALHVATFSEREAVREFGRVYPPTRAFTDSDWHAQSLELMLALRRLESSGLHFDAIEFPDYRGWAFCTLQEKRLKQAFRDAEIAIRLHSTDGILGRFEERPLSEQTAARHELERKALLDADRVIGHLAPIAQLNADFYGFDRSWMDRSSVELPPAVLAAEHSTPDVPRSGDLVFITKVQAVKGPDLFARAASQFMVTHRDYGGRAVFASHAPDAAYFERIMAMVPPMLRHRFLRVQGAREREAAMRAGIVVIPSLWESLGLAAYEASALGATLVLNGDCPAFGEASPWRHGENCFKGAGTIDGLAAALEQAWERKKPSRLVRTAEVPYFERIEARGAVALAPTSDSRSMVSVVITNHNLGAYLPEALQSIATSTYPEVEIVLVDDASTETLDLALLDRIDAEGQVKLIRNVVNRGLPASRNIGIRASTGRYVLPLDADDCISPHFIEMAVEALEASAEFDVVVPSAAYFTSDEDLAERRFVDYALFVGDAPSLGLIANRFSCATALMRRSLFERFAYNERLTSYEDWDLYLRLTAAGHRFVVTNEIGFFYRRRERSMVRSFGRERHFEIVGQIYEALTGVPRGARLSVFLSPLVRLLREIDELRSARVTLEREFESALRRREEERPLRYDIADRVNAILKSLPYVHPTFKRTASIARKVS